MFYCRHPGHACGLHFFGHLQQSFFFSSYHNPWSSTYGRELRNRPSYFISPHDPRNPRVPPTYRLPRVTHLRIFSPDSKSLPPNTTRRRRPRPDAADRVHDLTIFYLIFKVTCFCFLLYFTKLLFQSFAALGGSRRKHKPAYVMPRHHLPFRGCQPGRECRVTAVGADPPRIRISL